MSDEFVEVSDEDLAGFVQTLAGVRRRARQEASHHIAFVASHEPQRLYTYVDDLIGALYRPEAQTRWEILDALSSIAADRADLVGGACDGAEMALFDETSSAVRLAAFKFLIRFGASAPERSSAVWGLIDEAIQCYHGDPEYRGMLDCLIEFTQGDLSDQTREALRVRVSFDADHGHGYIKAFSGDILRLLNSGDEEETR
jgi:hypothetical protein